jgi:hypothetical protein
MWHTTYSTTRGIHDTARHVATNLHWRILFSYGGYRSAPHGSSCVFACYIPHVICVITPCVMSFCPARQACSGMGTPHSCSKRRCSRSGKQGPLPCHPSLSATQSIARLLACRCAHAVPDVRALPVPRAPASRRARLSPVAATIPAQIKCPPRLVRACTGSRCSLAWHRRPVRRT